MTQYFKPEDIWVGKLCYFAPAHGLLVPCRITSIVQDRQYGIGVIVLGCDIEHLTNILSLFDRRDS